MKKTIIYASIAALLVLTFILQEMTGDNRNTLSIPELPEKIDKIVLERGDKFLELFTDSESSESYTGWKVGSEAYPADGQKIEDLISAVESLRRADVISDREGYKKYGLDSDNERILRFIGDDKEILILRFGNNASSGNSVYARIQDNREVVMLPQDLSSQFSTESSDFREKLMASFPKDSIDRIEINSPDHEKLLITRKTEDGTDSKKPADTEASAPPEDSGDSEDSAKTVVTDWSVKTIGGEELETIEEGRFRDLFSELANLWAGDFPEEDPTGKPFADLVVHRNGGEREVISLWPPDGENNYPARVSTNRYSFTIPGWRTRKLFLGLDRYFQAFEKDDQ